MKIDSAECSRSVTSREFLHRAVCHGLCNEVAPGPVERQICHAGLRFLFHCEANQRWLLGRVFLPFAVARTIIENLVAHTCRIKRPDNLFLLQDRHVRSFFPMRHSAFSLSERFGGPHSGRFWLRICILVRKPRFEQPECRSLIRPSNSCAGSVGLWMSILQIA